MSTFIAHSVQAYGFNFGSMGGCRILPFMTLTVILLWSLASSGEELYTFDEFLESIATDKDCDELLESYANASAHFAYCAIKNARPIRICEQCVWIYLNVTKLHEKILQIEDGSGNKICKLQLMNLDRLQVIEENFHHVTGLWKRASCENCFVVTNNTMNKSNETLHFMDLLHTTDECFQDHLRNKTYSQDVCSACEEPYCALNKFYDQLKNANTQNSICMDIVDSMNITRMKWNEKLMCKKEIPKLDMIYLGCSCAIALLPLVFYIGAKLFTTVLRNRLQMQKRLAEVLRPSTSHET